MTTPTAPPGDPDATRTAAAIVYHQLVGDRYAAARLLCSLDPGQPESEELGEQERVTLALASMACGFLLGTFDADEHAAAGYMRGVLDRLATGEDTRP